MQQTFSVFFVSEAPLKIALPADLTVQLAKFWLARLN